MRYAMLFEQIIEIGIGESDPSTLDPAGLMNFLATKNFKVIQQ